MKYMLVMRATEETYKAFQDVEGGGCGVGEEGADGRAGQQV